MPVFSSPAENPLTISLDYDGTFSADTLLWTVFVEIAQSRGHIVVLISQRTEECGGRKIKDVAGALKIPYVLAGGMGKREAAIRAGYTVDIWIDDHPESATLALTYTGEDQDPPRPALDLICICDDTMEVQHPDCPVCSPVDPPGTHGSILRG